MASRTPDIILFLYSNRDELNMLISYASSYRCNPRNLEFPWYGPWTLTLTGLTHGRSDLSLMAQFPLYHTVNELRGDDEELELEGDEDKREEGENPDTPDEIDQQDEICDESDVEEEDRREAPKRPVLQAHPRPRTRSTFLLGGAGCEEDPDASSSSAMTVAGIRGKTSTYVPDYAILHHIAIISRVRDNFRKQTLRGLQITHTCCPIIVEIKKAPIRHLRGKKFRAALRKALSDAVASLYFQCGNYFAMFERASKVIAIAASGPNWYYRTVKFREFKGFWDDVSLDEKAIKMRAFSSLFEGNDIFELGTDKSDREMAALRKQLDKKPKYARR